MHLVLLAALAIGTTAAQIAPPPGPVVFGIDEDSLYITAVAADAAGNMYVAGDTTSSLSPTTAGSFQPGFAPGLCEGVLSLGLSPLCTEVLILKLDPEGNIVFSTYLSGDGGSLPTAIVVDAQGSIYVAGYAGRNFPTTAGVAFPTPSPPYDGGDFLAKLSAAGDKLIYSMYVPLGADALAVDSAGNAYIAGQADAKLPVTPGAFQTMLPATNPYGTGGLMKLSADGSKLLYATYLTGQTAVNANYFQSVGGIAVDAAGEAYVTGSTNGVDFPSTPGAYQTKLPSVPGNASAYVSKLNADGSALIYSTFLGAAGGDFKGSGGGEGGLAVQVDSSGEAWVLGSTTSTNFPLTSGAFQTSLNAPWAVIEGLGGFLAKLRADGSGLVSATYLTGAEYLAEDADGNAYVGGAASFGLPVTGGAYQRCMNGGGWDIFLTEFNPAGTLIGATYLGGAGRDAPMGVAALGNGAAVVAGLTTSNRFPGLAGYLPSGASLVATLRIDDPARTQSPCISLALENGASFAEGPIAPGEIVTIRGVGIGPTVGVNGVPDANGRLPVDLAGVKVFFEKLQAPLLYVQNGQVNAFVPWELSGLNLPIQSQTAVHVEFNGVVTNAPTIQLAPAAPGIFFTAVPQPTGTTLNQAAVLNEDGTLNSSTNPARRGSVISMFGTGGGGAYLPGITGGLWPLSPLAMLDTPVKVQIGGLFGQVQYDAPVLYEGSAPGLNSGVFQMNVALPLELQPGAQQITLNAEPPPANPPAFFVQ